MRTIYEGAQGKSLLIYSYGNNLYLKSLQGEIGNKPVLLAGDYLDGLSDVLYNNTVYYAYRNQQKNIIIKNVMEQTVTYQIQGQESMEVLTPNLVVCEGKLLFLYIRKNPLAEEYYVQGGILEEHHAAYVMENEFVISDCCLQKPSISVTLAGKSVILSVYYGEEENFYHMDTYGNWEKMISEFAEKERRQANENLQIQIGKIQQGLVLQKQQLDAQENEMRQFKQQNQQQEEKIREQAQEITQQEEKIRKQAQEITQKEEEIRQNMQIIESVKVQYQELMQTAEAYRNEAMKWIEKAYSPKSYLIEGEE